MSMRRIWVRGPNWLGDHIMAEPFFAGFRKLYQNDHITLVSRIDADELGNRHWDDSRKPGNEPRGADLAVTLVSSFSAAWALWRSGARVRVGFAEWAGRGLLTDALTFPGRRSQRHKRELYGDLIRYLGGEPVEPVRRKTKKTDRIIIAPGASIGLREWPYFLELIEQINKSWPRIEVMVVGSHESLHWSSRMRRLNLRVNDRIAKTKLSDLVRLFDEGGLVLANDSGVAHLAASRGCSTLVLFGPGDPGYVLPAGPAQAIRNAQVACSPCESANCRAPYGYQRCLRDLSVETVLNHIQVQVGLSWQPC